MHFIVSYDIIDSDEVTRKTIEEQIDAAFKPYDWVKPLTTFYIVRVSMEAERVALVGKLTEVAQKNPQKIRIVASPLMAGGSYAGWLPQSWWDAVNMRATP